MHWYTLLKTLHVACVTLSFTLFTVRGAWMIADSDWLQWRPLRVLPHLVDSVLLASAIGLVLMLHQYPFVHDWLTAKVIALAIYIGLGTLALKRARSKRVRVMTWLAALLVFAYIVSVAIAHNPCGFFGSYFYLAL